MNPIESSLNFIPATCRGLAIGLLLVAGLCLLPATPLAAAVDALVPSEEFVGPFASWKNLKTDFGAKGDGKADDTAAFKAGLAALKEYGKGKPGDPVVLYLPAGTYRITEPLVWVNRMNVALLGEDPTTTIVRYDGPAGEVMLTCHGVSYSQFGRITWDGQGKARAAVAHQWNSLANPGDRDYGFPAGSHLEHADEVFQDCGKGIIGGWAPPYRNDDGTISGYGQSVDAETLLKRCKFIRCREAGLSIESFNALNWWVWDSEFIDCGAGTTNCAKDGYGGGHFHLYRCLFRGSKIADIRTGHCSYFGFRFNTSIGSRRFLETIRPEGYGKENWGKWSAEDPFGSQTTVQGNRIINPTDPTPIFINQYGPLMLLDNTFVVKPDGDKPVVQVAPPTVGAQCVSIGNHFFGAARIEVKGNLVEQDNTTLDYAKADLTVPGLSPTAPPMKRRVFDLKTGATGAEIQAAINAAAKLNGQKPLVHLAAGRYPVSVTLSIPAGADLQFVGDGWETILIWEGENDGTMLKLAGPVRATLRDFRIAGIWNSKGQILGRGIVAENLDQKDGLILLDQVYADGCTRSGFLFDGLTKTRVEAQGSGSSGIDGPALTVDGGGDEKNTAWVGFFGSIGGNNQETYVVKNSGNLMLWDTWYGIPPNTASSEPRYIHLTDRGNLTFFNGRIATLPSREARWDLPSIDLDGFIGHFTMVGVQMDTLNPQVRLAGTGEGLKALAVGIAFSPTEPHWDNQADAAEFAVLASRQNDKNLPTEGKSSPEFLREMLARTRTELPTRWQPAPAGATDLRLHRVMVYVKVGDGMIFSARNVSDKPE